MIFNFKTDKFTTERNSNGNILYADSTMFGNDLRLGDFVMYSLLLFCLKSQLIAMYPKRFNSTNLYFKLNMIGKCCINDIDILMKWFPNVWKNNRIINKSQNNINQLIDGGNLWAFKCYLERTNIKLNNSIFKNYHLIDPVEGFNRDTNPSTVYIFPVRKKNYNTERNFNYKMIYDIIVGLNLNKKVVVITKDTDIKFHYLTKTIKRDLTELNDKSWNDIILDIIKDGERLITGDCGLAHFISMIKAFNKPRLTVYYKTAAHIITAPMNEFDKKMKVINFKPYSPYITDSISIRTF